MTNRNQGSRPALMSLIVNYGEHDQRVLRVVRDIPARREFAVAKEVEAGFAAETLSWLDQDTQEVTAA